MGIIVVMLDFTRNQCNTALGFLLGIALAVLACLLYFWLLESPLCKDCSLQGWLGATSGWAAALAAALTIGFLSRQSADTRRQTEYMVGDADPTASLFDPRVTKIENAWSNRLDIVNWNRNPILLNRVYLASGEAPLVFKVDVEDEDPARKQLLIAELNRGRMRIPGWKDRSGIPTVAELSVNLLVEKLHCPGFEKNDFIRGKVDILIDLTILAERPRKVCLRVERPDALMTVV